VERLNNESAYQDIPCLLRNQNVQHHIYKTLPLDSILGQMNPVHILTTCFFKIHFNINLLPMLRSPKRSLPFRISN